VTRRLLFTLWLVALGSAPAAAAVTVGAQLDRSTVRVGEQVGAT